MNSTELTLIIIKPDAVQSGNAGKILDRIIQEKFIIRALKQKHLTVKEMQIFYLEHKNRPFYDELTNYMSSHPSIIACLEKDDAIKRWRQVIGATNPDEAEANTIRKKFGKSKSENAVHGSDSQNSAKREISFFFSGLDLL